MLPGIGGEGASFSPCRRALACVGSALPGAGGEGASFSPCRRAFACACGALPGVGGECSSFSPCHCAFACAWNVLPGTGVDGAGFCAFACACGMLPGVGGEGASFSPCRRAFACACGALPGAGGEGASFSPCRSRLCLRVERVAGNRRRRCKPLPLAPGCALGMGVLPTACIGSVPAGGRAAGRIPLRRALPQKSPRGSLVQCSSMRPELM